MLWHWSLVLGLDLDQSYKHLKLDSCSEKPSCETQRAAHAVVRRAHALIESKAGPWRSGPGTPRRQNWSAFPAHMTGVKGDWELTAAQRHSLQQVQNTIAELPPVVERAMLWLVVVSVSATPQGAHEDAEDIITTLLQSGGCELHVHHFDATSESDPAYQSYMQLEWYRRARPRFRRVFFRTETGCKLEQWRESMRLLLSTSSASRYTHVWFLDSDLRFGLFDMPAFRALVAHTAPVLAQPGIVSYKHGARATDYWSLNARLYGNVLGRRRIIGLEKDILRTPVEVQAPLLDMRMVPAFHKSTMHYDTRLDSPQQRALNRVAWKLAQLLHPLPRARPQCNVTSAKTSAAPSAVVSWASRTATLQIAQLDQVAERPAGLVYDWTPLIHRWRGRLPPKRGRRGPPHGPPAIPATLKLAHNIGSQEHGFQHISQCVRGHGVTSDQRARALLVEDAQRRLMTNSTDLFARGEIDVSCPWDWFQLTL
jgi:hypothetical protein